jgi:integrase
MARMSKTVSILRVRHPRYKFKVSFRETQQDGRPARRFAYFTTKGEAAAFAAGKGAELTNHGTRHGSVEDDERAALIRYRSWAAKRDEAPPLSLLVARAIAAYETARRPLTVAEAIDARLDAADRRKLSARHQADLKCRLARFAQDFGALQVADVRLADVEAWLHRLEVSAGTWTNYARVIGSVFTLAVKRGFIPSNPLAGLDKPKITRKAPAILTPSQFGKLLAASAPELRPLLVLQGFCGLRRSEALRVCWQHIHLDGAAPYVELPTEVTKTNRRRSHEIPGCAVAWLRPLAGLPAAPLTLTDTVYNLRLREAATTAGITWEENLLRHSFGTYRLAVTKNAAAVAEEMGNSAAVVRTHYANVTSPKAAAEWWNITPAPPVETVPFRRMRAAS